MAKTKTVRGGQEVRTIPVPEIREGGDGRPVLEGYAVMWDSWSEDLGGFRERFLKGAFARSIAEDDIRVLWQHNGEYVFGRNKAGTAEFIEDDKGLLYRATPPDAQWARDALESIRRGDVDQNSFMFAVPKGGDEEVKRDGIWWRTVREAKLYEAGPQTFPAYPDTSAYLRSLEDRQGSEEAPLEESEPTLDELRELRQELIRASL